MHVRKAALVLASSLVLLAGVAPGPGCGGAEGGDSDVNVVLWQPEVGSAPTGNPRIGLAVFPGRRLLVEPRIIDAAPARRGDAGWERQCGAGPADGLLVQVALSGTRVQAVCGPAEDALDSDVSLRPGDALGQVGVILWIYDGGCPGQTTFADSANGCQPLAKTTLYCGPAKALGPRDLVFDPSHLTGESLGSEPVSLPDGVTEADVARWIAENAPRLNNYVAELIGADADGPADLAIGGDGALDPAVTTADLALTVDCLEPAAATSGATCAPPAGGATIEAVTYAARTPRRETPHDLVLLIDQSGSTSGLVDRDRGDREADPGDFSIPPNFGQLASDVSHSRLAAARRVLRTLAGHDRVGVVAFNSLGLTVPCGAAPAAVVTDLASALPACFGAEPDLDSLAGIGQGRSNLWEAVLAAYDFLRADTSGDPAASKDIVVIADGPDSCSGEELTPCTAPCSDVSAAQVRARIEADEATPAIRVHFVQFESVGYPGRDPRQVEVACVSGGSYRYVDSLRFSHPQLRAPFLDALIEAISNVRLALMGQWEVAAALPSYAASDTSAGALQALSGELIVRATAGLTAVDRAASFGIGGDLVWDQRVVVRKPCSADSDCGAGEGGGACVAVCSPETLTCPNGAAGLSLPDGAACVGDAGTCCAGACQAGGACASCP